MNRTDKSPWYKQFWPWFLITIPLLSMILSITMLNLALTTEDSLVIDDYYKEGRGINMQLSKIKQAQKLNIRTQLGINGVSVQLRFVSGKPSSGEALQLAFHHATLEQNDFTVLLTSDAQGIYRATLDNEISGKWKVTLLPLDGEWKVLQDVFLPRAQSFDFNP
ncbi:FixH family protein [Aliiglaciecola sp. LCG003]|uniref:FixH family protein n=1 Tax=Aliiglaciecola sp. LCG003 TaxID=3053655 RepID=UPI00257236CC|nr:FixH family protein [Aliiglaciecola sp. LCG003]WJG07605.1 FixH family protein [Aliiglaciecola sp. LCG003]